MSSSVGCITRFDLGPLGRSCRRPAEGPSIVGGRRLADSVGVPLAFCCPWRATRNTGVHAPSERAEAAIDRGHPIGFRVILTIGLVALYLAGCLAALALLAQIWTPSH